MCRVGSAGPHCGANILEGSLETGAVNAPSRAAGGTSSKQKINKETQVLNDALDEMELIDIFRTFHPNAEEDTLFSSAHRTFSRIDHILGHKSSLGT